MSIRTNNILYVETILYIENEQFKRCSWPSVMVCEEKPWEIGQRDTANKWLDKRQSSPQMDNGQNKRLRRNLP